MAQNGGDQSHRAVDHSSEFRRLRFAEFVVRHPWLLLLAVVLFTVFCIVIVVATGESPSAEDNSDRSFDVKTSGIVRTAYAFEEALEVVTFGAGAGIVQAVGQVDVPEWRIFVLYASKRGPQLVTPANIAEIRALEASFVAHPRYPYFCFTAGLSRNCSADAVVSITQYINASWDQAQIDAFLLSAAAEIGNQTDLGGELQLFFHEDFSMSNLNSPLLRSVFKFGAPLGDDGSGQPFRNANDRIKDQNEQFHEMVRIVDSHFRTGGGQSDNIETTWIGEEGYNYVFGKIVDEDLAWAYPALLFVVVWMWLHSHSLVLAIMGMLQIVLSFPIAFFIYANIAQISMFHSMNVLAIFVVLGVGADDVFIFFDAWNQAAVFPFLRGNLELRMSYAWRRAAKAMFYSSSTTMAAFFSTGISPIAPLAGFGFWSAFLILVNYLLAITWLPACIVLWHRYVRNRCNCGWWTTHEADASEDAARAKPLPSGSAADLEVPQPASAVSSSASADATKLPAPAAAANGASADDLPGKDETMVAGGGGLADNDTSRLNAVERFFHNVWAPLIERFKYPLLVIFVVALVLSIYGAAQIAPLSERENFFPPDHWITRASDKQDLFKKGPLDFAIKVFFVWGVIGLDTRGVDRFNPDDVGRPVFDSAFDLSDPAAQLYVLETCGMLRQRTDLLNPAFVDCVLEDYRAYRLARSLDFPATFNASSVAERQLLMSADLRAFVNFTLNTTGLDLVRDTKALGLDTEGRLRFVSISAIALMDPFQPYDMTHPLYLEFEAIANARANNASAPPTARSCLQTALEFWKVFVTERALQTSSLQGLALSMSLTFFVLLLATQNIVLSIYCIVVVGAAVAAVIALIVARGWPLGVSESIAVVVLIGFAVDYTVHLAGAYVESLALDRAARMRDSLTTLGVSVFSSAATTLGASLFLIPTTIIFFAKFAFIMSMTIVFAFSYSITFFAAACFAFGPEGTTGDLRHYWRLLRARCAKVKPAAGSPKTVELS